MAGLPEEETLKVKVSLTTGQLKGTQGDTPAPGWGRFSAGSTNVLWSLSSTSQACHLLGGGTGSTSSETPDRRAKPHHGARTVPAGPEHGRDTYAPGAGQLLLHSVAVLPFRRQLSTSPPR